MQNSYVTTDRWLYNIICDTIFFNPKMSYWNVEFFWVIAVRKFGSTPGVSSLRPKCNTWYFNTLKNPVHLNTLLLEHFSTIVSCNSLGKTWRLMFYVTVLCHTVLLNSATPLNTDSFPQQPKPITNYNGHEACSPWCKQWVSIHTYIYIYIYM
jgi:hypothetical protein